MFRQKNPEFVETLNELRSATLTPASIQRLKAAQHHKLADSQPTRLCAHNSTAETQNSQCLSKLQGPAVSYAAYDSGDQYHVDQMAKNSSAPTNLMLKLGAKVIHVEDAKHDLSTPNKVMLQFDIEFIFIPFHFAPACSAEIIA